VGILAVLLLGCAVPLFAVRLSILKAALAGAVVAAAYLAGVQLAFEGGVVLPIVYPLASLALAAVTAIVARYYTESRERRFVARLNEVLEAKVSERTRELRESQLEVIQRLGRAVDSRDEDTGDHIARIGELCHALGLAVGMSAEDAEMLRRASAMHDVGKIAVPDHVLRKPGRLEPHEWEIMKQHTTVGAEMLAGSGSPLVQLAEKIALTHHERWDGSGYPHGLSGEEIPLEGRICGICDVFDALTSDRPYKRAWPVAEVLEEIRSQAGAHFDPRLVPLFVELASSLGHHRAADVEQDRELIATAAG